MSHGVRHRQSSGSPAPLPDRDISRQAVIDAAKIPSRALGTVKIQSVRVFKTLQIGVFDDTVMDRHGR
ncbi:hypothetical protein C8R44DRAFT_806503 [Mycena epipterygia]|nr:hypothetical protein C8R44DRAFT_806503 [Mycena epipterygia]